MAVRLVIKIVVTDANGKVFGGQEFDAVGPQAPTSYKQIYEAIAKQYYHPENPKKIMVKQAGKIIGVIGKSGTFMDPNEDPAGFVPDAVPQYDLRVQFPEKYPPSNLVTIFRRQEGEAWDAQFTEVHTEDTVQARLRTLKAIRDGAFEYHCRIIK